jgi:TonB family protein
MSAICFDRGFDCRRVYIAVALSILAHIFIVVIAANDNNELAYIENGMRFSDKARISVNISKIKPKKVVETKEADIVEEIKKPVEENEEKVLEAIPVVENAKFRGERVPPIYPKRALQFKQEGVVVLQALIDIDGSIKNVKLVNSSGYAILDKSAINAVWKWKFEPSVIDGEPVLSWIKVPVEFVIR